MFLRRRMGQAAPGAVHHPSDDHFSPLFCRPASARALGTYIDSLVPPPAAPAAPAAPAPSPQQPQQPQPRPRPRPRAHLPVLTPAFPHHCGRIGAAHSTPSAGLHLHPLILAAHDEPRCSVARHTTSPPVAPPPLLLSGPFDGPLSQPTSELPSHSRPLSPK